MVFSTPQNILQEMEEEEGEGEEEGDINGDHYISLNGFLSAVQYVTYRGSAKEMDV